MILLLPAENLVFNGRSRDQPGFSAKLYGLRSPPGAEFVEYSTGMRLDRAFANKQALGNFAVAEPNGNQP
jgi:hypothetical protein